jgi:hypothetical protein
MIILPRQALDKHRESTQKESHAFSYSALQQLEDYEIQRRELEAKASGSSPPPRFPPNELLEEGVPPPHPQVAPSWEPEPQLSPPPRRAAQTQPAASSRVDGGDRKGAKTPQQSQGRAAVTRARVQAAKGKAVAAKAAVMPAEAPAPTAAPTAAAAAAAADIEAAAQATRAKVRLHRILHTLYSTIAGGGGDCACVCGLTRFGLCVCGCRYVRRRRPLRRALRQRGHGSGCWRWTNRWTRRWPTTE